MLQIHICERFAQYLQVVSISPPTHRVVCWLSVIWSTIHNINMVRFQTWDQNSYITNFQLSTQILKNPMKLVLSLSFSNCSWNQVECLSCCLSFCRMMVFAYLLTHSLLFHGYSHPWCSLSASSSATKSVYTLHHELKVLTEMSSVTMWGGFGFSSVIWLWTIIMPVSIFGVSVQLHGDGMYSRWLYKCLHWCELVSFSSLDFTFTVSLAVIFDTKSQKDMFTRIFGHPKCYLIVLAFLLYKP